MRSSSKSKSANEPLSKETSEQTICKMHTLDSANSNLNRPQEENRDSFGSDKSLSDEEGFGKDFSSGKNMGKLPYILRH